MQKDVGSVRVPGTTFFDGDTFTLECAGTDIGDANDQFHFVYLPMTGDGTITARFVPQVPSQFAKMGLMMRESLAADAAHASLLITPATTKSVEMPNWSISLFTRRATGAENNSSRQLSSASAALCNMGPVDGAVLAEIIAFRKHFHGFHIVRWTKMDSDRYCKYSLEKKDLCRFGRLLPTYENIHNRHVQ